MPNPDIRLIDADAVERLAHRIKGECYLCRSWMHPCHVCEANAANFLASLPVAPSCVTREQVEALKIKIEHADKEHWLSESYVAARNDGIDAVLRLFDAPVPTEESDQ